jgi:hypothetical protein
MYANKFTARYVFDGASRKGHWELSVHWTDSRVQVIESTFPTDHARSIHATSGQPGTCCDFQTPRP